MKHNHDMIALLFGLFSLSFISLLPSVTYGSEIFDDDADNVNNSGRDSDFKQKHFNGMVSFTSRVLQDDDTCVNACDDESLSSFQASFRINDASKELEETEDEDENFLSRITGFFKDSKGLMRRLMNGLFKLLNRSNEDDPTFLIPTEKILPLLSNYSTKFNALASLIRNESVYDVALSETPDAIQMMYDLSAENMESVALVLEPILENWRKQETIDARTMSCNVMQVVSILGDKVVPTVEMMTKVIYTKSNNAAMMERFKYYTMSSDKAVGSSTSSATASSSSQDNTCPDVSSQTTAARTIQLDGIFQFLFDISVDIGPIGHIARIILLIVLFPLSFVVSLLGAIFFVLYLVITALNPPDQAPGEGTGYEFIFLLVAVVATVGAPVIVVFTILRNILGFFEDILDPFIPDAPTTRAPRAPTTGPPTPFLVRNESPQTIEVAHQLSAVLTSPLDTFSAIFQSVNSYSDASKGEEEAVNCEMVELKCNKDALDVIIAL